MQRATAPFEVVSHSIAVPTQAACTFTVQCTNSLAAPPLDATTVLCINNGEQVSGYSQVSLSHAQCVDLLPGRNRFYREWKLSLTEQSQVRGK